MPVMFGSFVWRFHRRTRKCANEATPGLLPVNPDKGHSQHVETCRRFEEGALASVRQLVYSKTSAFDPTLPRCAKQLQQEILGINFSGPTNNGLCFQKSLCVDGVGRDDLGVCANSGSQLRLCCKCEYQLTTLNKMERQVEIKCG